MEILGHSQISVTANAYTSRPSCNGTPRAASHDLFDDLVVEAEAEVEEPDPEAGASGDEQQRGDLHVWWSPRGESTS
jgi:hypothetical protein